MFSPGIYQERRQKLVQSMDTGIILFMGNNDSPMNYPDNIYPFRQDSNFLYFAGLDLPHLSMIIDIESGVTTLYGDDVSLEMVVWTGPQPSVKSLAALADIPQTSPSNTLAGDVEKALKQGRKIHFLPPYRFENQIRIAQMLDIPIPQLGLQASEALIKAVVDLRSIKGPEEIVELDRACDITADMHLAAMRTLRPGIKESEVVAAVRQVALLHGGDVSYPVIGTIH